MRLPPEASSGYHAAVTAARFARKSGEADAADGPELGPERDPSPAGPAASRSTPREGATSVGRIFTGVLAGLAAAALLAGVMVLGSAFGLTPRAELIDLFAALLAPWRSLASPEVLAWGAYFALFGLLWGGVYGAVAGRLSGNDIFDAVVVMAAGWLVTMAAVAALAGMSWFAQGIAGQLAVLALIFYMVFAVVMGLFAFRMRELCRTPADRR